MIYIYGRLDSLNIGGTNYSILAKFHEATGGQVTIDKGDIVALLDLARSLTSVRQVDLTNGKLSQAKRQEITDKLTAVKSGFADLIAWSGSSSPQGEFIDFIKAVNDKLVQRSISPGALERPLIESALEVLRKSGASSTYKAVYGLAESVLDAANEVLGTYWTLATVSAANVENGLGALFLGLDGNNPQGVKADLFQSTYEAILGMLEPFYLTVSPPPPPPPPSQPAPVVDEDDVQEQINQGKEQVEISVPEDAEPAAVLTTAALEKLVQANKPLVLNIKGVAFTLEPGTIQAAQGASGVKLEAKPLSEDQASRLVGDLPSTYKVAGKVLSLTAASVVGEAVQPVTFQKPVTVSVNYDPASITNPDFLGAYRYNTETKKWDYLGGKVDKNKKVVTFATPHLSEYALMEYHKTFGDIRGSFAKADVEYLASRYIIYGVTDTKFDPLGKITRAQFCALVARALNLSPPQNAPSFKDVSGSYWAAKEIRAAAAKGIVKGYTDGTFKPDQFINREQLAAMVARALVYSRGGTLPTPDQAQTILARFQDRNRITAGLLQEAALAADKGIVLGTGDQRFDPFGTATREQAAAMLARMFRQLP